MSLAERHWAAALSGLIHKKIDMLKYQNVTNFFLDDYPRTLFPLETNRIIIKNNTDDIVDYIYEILQKGQLHFFLQKRVYASKPRMHLRRTVKLDPVAEFFIYDLIYRNRISFRKDLNDSRRNFGYRIKDGKVISPRGSYRAFKAAISEAIKKYKFWVKFDISCYFNSIYHHDLVKWFNDGSRSEDDVSAFGLFLRETNSGRSVDCLPQGIIPCKIIGSHFLKFIDNSNRVRSDLLLRFMDDFYLFSDNEDIVFEDFALIQCLLGEKGLSVNPLKTQFSSNVEHIDIQDKIDEIKLSLLKVRRTIIEGYDNAIEIEDLEESKLNKEQIEYLLILLKQEDIEEEDAELILTLMWDYSSDVVGYISYFLERFPNLSKNIFHFCKYISDKNTIAEQIHEFIKTKKFLTEFQLFWLAKICEEYLLTTKYIGNILVLLFEHTNATIISKAKVLEIPEQRFGMKDLREEQLRTGKSDWLSWAAAIGCRKEKKSNRNHLLKYFSNAGPMNQLIANCVISL